MRWVVYIEVQGLLAAVHPAPRPAGGRPRAVIRDGMVVDGSPLALQQGLRRGMPVWQAQRQVPDILVLAADAVDYGPAQRAFWDACLEFTPWVEPVASHQAFLSLPAAGPPPRSELARLLERLQSAIGQVVATGLVQEYTPLLNLSCGLAANKLVARAAATAGTAVVQPGAEAAFLAPLPVTALWRADAGTQERLRSLGLSHVADIQQLPAAELHRQFGAAGDALRRWAQGEDLEPVRATYPARCITARLPLAGGAGVAGLAAVVTRAAGELAAKLDRELAAAQRLELDIHVLGAADLTYSRGLPRPRQGAFALEHTLTSLLHEFLVSRPVAKARAEPVAITVRAGDLSPASWQQLDLWGQEAAQAGAQAEKLERALAALQSRFPAGTARVGATPKASRREAMLGFYDPYRWSASRRGGQDV